MSDWHDEFAEPMHDTPADKDPLIAAMEAAGYTYDGLESTNDNLRFFGEGGQVITMGGWHECEEWLNGVVFDDPQVMNRVEIILHPERFPEKDPGRAALRAVEDAVEQNDNCPAASQRSGLSGKRPFRYCSEAIQGACKTNRLSSQSEKQRCTLRGYRCCSAEEAGVLRSISAGTAGTGL